MANHRIFNERPESQDRAIKVIEKLGYTIVPRSEAEAKRGSRKAVLFEDELQTFCFKNGFDLKTQRGKGFLSKPLFAIIKCPEVRSIYVIKLMEKAGAWTHKEQK